MLGFGHGVLISVRVYYWKKASQQLMTMVNMVSAMIEFLDQCLLFTALFLILLCLPLNAMFCMSISTEWLISLPSAWNSGWLLCWSTNESLCLVLLLSVLKAPSCVCLLTARCTVFGALRQRHGFILLISQFKSSLFYDLKLQPILSPFAVSQRSTGRTRDVSLVPCRGHHPAADCHCLLMPIEWWVPDGFSSLLWQHG